MAMNPLPPQAYTKDTLQKAYSWLSTQDPSIRAMASTADILVSLYLKATRDGDSVLQRPSIQNFKNELKHLAPMVEEFERSGEKLSMPEITPLEGMGETVAEKKPLDRASISSLPGESHFLETSPSSMGALNPSAVESLFAMDAESPKGGFSTRTPPPSLKLTPRVFAADLDEKSIFWIREVREKFNLSNDQEALRLLVRIGYSKVSGLLKD